MAEEQKSFHGCLEAFAEIIVGSSRLLGEGEGMFGNDNPAVSAYHQLAIVTSKKSGYTPFGGENPESTWVEPARTEKDSVVPVFMKGYPLVIPFKGCKGCDLTTTCNKGGAQHCFGRCGNGCNCWYWKCGTCECVQQCQEHDYHCSCEGMTTFWCLNAFWVNCNEPAHTDRQGMCEGKPPMRPVMKKSCEQNISDLWDENYYPGTDDCPKTLQEYEECCRDAECKNKMDTVSKQTYCQGESHKISSLKDFVKDLVYSQLNVKDDQGDSKNGKVYGLYR